MKKSDLQLTKQWVTIADAARFLGVSQDTLRRWEKKGTLIPRRTVGGHRRYSRMQLERLLRQPMTAALDQKPTKPKEVYQVQIPPQTAVIPENPTIVTKTNKTYPIINNIIKTNFISIIIVGLIVSLIIASYILLQITRENLTPPVSPVPSYKSLQLP